MKLSLTLLAVVAVTSFSNNLVVADELDELREQVSQLSEERDVLITTVEELDAQLQAASKSGAGFEAADAWAHIASIVDTASAEVQGLYFEHVHPVAAPHIETATEAAQPHVNRLTKLYEEKIKPQFDVCAQYDLAVASVSDAVAQAKMSVSEVRIQAIQQLPEIEPRLTGKTAESVVDWAVFSAAFFVLWLFGPLLIRLAFKVSLKLTKYGIIVGFLLALVAGGLFAAEQAM